MIAVARWMKVRCTSQSNLAKSVWVCSNVPRLRAVEEARFEREKWRKHGGGTDGGSRAGRDINDRDGEVEDDDASERERRSRREREKARVLQIGREAEQRRGLSECMYVYVCMKEREKE